MLVSDHVINHIWEPSYLLTFDNALNPRLSFSKPPTPDELIRARWSVGGQAVWLRAGKVRPGADRRPDARTAVAIDVYRKVLYLAVAEKISPRLLLEKLAGLGAKDGMLLDGGTSSARAFGKDLRNARMGVAFGGWRPLPTFFGVRARPLGN
jgi:Phosphodiester glycosidase